MKVEVLETFRMIKPVGKLKRANASLDVDGYFYKGDTFECNERIANYLINENLVVALEENTPIVEPNEENTNASVLDENVEEDKAKNGKRTAKKNIVEL